MDSLGDRDLLDYYLQLYFYELTHRDAINDRLTHSTTVLALLAAGLVYLLDHPVSEAAASERAWWIGLLVVGTGLLVVGIFATALAWWGFRYRFAADPEKTEAWRAEMAAKGAQSGDVGRRMLKNVLTQLAGTAAHNRTMNRKKSRRAAAGRFAILLAALAYGLALIPWALAI